MGLSFLRNASALTTELGSRYDTNVAWGGVESGVYGLITEFRDWRRYPEKSAFFS